MSLELIKLLLVAARLLMISMGRVTRILGTSRAIFCLLTFQIIVWQVANLILVLLLLVLRVRAVVVHVCSGNYVLCVLYEILVA